MRKSLLVTAALLLTSPVLATDDEGGWANTFPPAEQELVASGGNRYWSLKPGRFVVLGELTPNGGEFVLISVLDETETVDGIETRVIEEREFEDGELVEVSRNFFAMAKKSKDVYYFGEDVNDYANGEVSGHGGQWRAGTDGARAGLYMPAKPAVGMRYYMEYHPGVAMDRAEIFATDANVEAPAGTFKDSLIVSETSPLEPDDESYKRYAPGVGMIFDDGLELLKRGRRHKSEKLIEFEIAAEQLPRTPARIVRELHPTGVIKEVKVEIRDHVRYAIETFIDGQQWDVEINDDGKVFRNSED